MDQGRTGKMIGQLRREKGLTQEQMAERFAVSCRTVSRWETGRNLPELELLIEMADFFEVDLRALLEGERTAEETDQKTKEMVRRAADYSGEEKRHLLKRLHLLFLSGLAAGGISFVLSALEAIPPAARFLIAFSQGIAFGLTAVGTLVTGQHAAVVHAAKLRMIHRLNVSRKR